MKTILSIFCVVLLCVTTWIHTHANEVTQAEVSVIKMKDTLNQKLYSRLVEIHTKKPWALSKIRSILSKKLPTYTSTKNKQLLYYILYAIQEIENGESTMTETDLSENWDILEVHYSLKLSQQKFMESSLNRNETFRFELGAWQVIQGWEKGLVWAKEWDVLSIAVPPKMWYWIEDPNRVQVVPKSELKAFKDAGITLEVWSILPTQFGKFAIKSVDADSVIVDVNHELAWETLYFDIVIMNITKKEASE